MKNLLAIAAGLFCLLLGPVRLSAEAIPHPPNVWLTELETWQSLWVGAVVGGREVGSLEILMRGEHFLIPLEGFAQIARCEVRLEDDGVTHIDTPMGGVAIPPEDLRVLDGVAFVTRRFLEKTLVTQVVFDSGEYAVRFQLPWNADAGGPRTPREELVADVAPPRASIATLRSDSQYRSQYRPSGDGEGTLDHSATLAGRLSGGRWRLRLDARDGEQHPREYAWLRTSGNRLLFAGQQRVQLHPLLRGFEMTGVQAAWTNQPLELFGDALEPGEMLPRRLQPVSSFRGEGPPAGVAELRIDDAVIARRTIGLDGLYEFLDVILPARQLSRVTVHVYERQNLQVPREIHDHSLSTSEFLLGEGALVHLGGAGRAGNLLDERISDFPSTGTSADSANAFYQMRYGLTSNLTLEAAVQHTDDGTQMLAGAVARLGRNLLLSLGAGQSGDAWGYDLTLDGQWNRWRLLGRSRLLGAGFEADPYAAQDIAPPASWDHYVEVGYRSGPRFDLALIGRSRRTSGLLEDADYLLPALSWRPTIRTALRARPDVNGDYRFDFSHRLSDALRLGVSFQDRAFVDLDYRLGVRSQLAFGAEFGGAGVQGVQGTRGVQGERYSLTYTASGLGPRRFGWAAGALWSGGEMGYRVGAHLALLPAVLLRAEVVDDPQTDLAGHRRGAQIQVGLSADLAFARGRVLPARSVAAQSSRGAITGRIVIDAPPGFPAPQIPGVRILVNGMPATATYGGGSFFIGNLEEAVYRVELDPELLPIELAPQSVSINAQVMASAVTRVDFIVRPEFGLAGRVRDTAGNPLPSQRVVLRALTGDDEQSTHQQSTHEQSTHSDLFGLFRFDGLPIGRYLLLLPDLPQAGKSSERIVEIRDDFLFDQDLTIAQTALEMRAP